MGIARGVNSGQKRALAKVGSREPLLPFFLPPSRHLAASWAGKDAEPQCRIRAGGGGGDRRLRIKF